MDVINFAQSAEQRGEFCNYATFEAATRPFPRALFGPENHQPGFGMGKVPFRQLQRELRDNRVYFYTGTFPASYTLNFIEAFMTGIPIVAIGPQLGNRSAWRDHDLYEIQDFIQHGINGFISDDIRELQRCIRLLLDDYELARRISEEGRKTAITHFGKDLIREAWRAFLEKG